MTKATDKNGQRTSEAAPLALESVYHVLPWEVRQLELGILSTGVVFLAALQDDIQGTKDEQTHLQDCLPTEFFGHQLIDLKLHDPECVRAFCSTWGIVRVKPSEKGPYPDGSARYILARPEESEQLIRLDEVTFALGLMQESVRLCMAVDYSTCEEELLKECQKIEANEALFTKGVATLDEVARSTTRALEFLNSAFLMGGIQFARITMPQPLPKACEGASLRVKAKAQGSLAEAICLQFFETLANPAPWHVCRNESCQRRFKYRQNMGDTSNEDTRPREGQYCRVNCGTIQRRRENNRKALHHEVVEIV